jgi:hypothetical protein
MHPRPVKLQGQFYEQQAQYDKVELLLNEALYLLW